MPVTQFRARPGIVDLAWGHPAPGALPVDEWAQAYARALDRYGPAALAYGHGPGPQPLAEWICARLGETDRCRAQPEQICVTAGASQAIELLCAVLLRPGDVVLVDAPTYHLALRIIADHQVEIVPVVDDPRDARRQIERLQRAGRRVPLLYLVPTFSNPTGASLDRVRRAGLVEVARQTGTVLVEDDTYRELSYDGPAPPSLRSLAQGPEVVRVGSFAKSVAPGLRLGWIEAEPVLVGRLVDRGFAYSGGGLNHTAAVALAEFGTCGAYARHVEAIRARYRAHRDALAAAVARHVPAADFAIPGGGWFLWLRLPDGVDSADLLPPAERAGVSFVDGRRFYVNGAGAGYLRLSFSMLEPAVLEEAARRLGATVADVLEHR